MKALSPEGAARARLRTSGAASGGNRIDAAQGRCRAPGWVGLAQCTRPCDAPDAGAGRARPARDVVRTAQLTLNGWIVRDCSPRLPSTSETCAGRRAMSAGMPCSNVR